MEWDFPKPWEWEVGGRYGRWYVDRYIRGDKSHAMYGDSILCNSKRQATEIANALNWAFNEGVKYGDKMATQIHTGENRADAAHDLFHRANVSPSDKYGRCSLCPDE